MRYCLCLLALMAAALLNATDPAHGNLVRGKLIVRQGQPTAIETPEHQMIALEGDDSTLKVLADPRVNGFDVQARGHFNSPGHFQIDASHTHPLLVHQDGKLKMITYWCDVCSIRAYTPGPCVCCQKETTIDLRDPDEK